MDVKLRILRAIDRPIEEMTVGQICEAAQVSRQTFYAHFNAKFDVAYWYMAIAEEKYLYEIGRTLTLEEGLNGFFQFLYKEKGSLVNAFEKDPRKRELRHRLEKPAGEFLWTLQSKGVDLTDDVRFCVTYTVESANCLVASWCLGGMAEDPQLIARRLFVCTPELIAQHAAPYKDEVL